MCLFAFTTLQIERERFEFQNQFERIAAHKIQNVYEDIHLDLNYLNIESNNETIDEYYNMVNSTFDSEYFLQIDLNQTHVIILDENLEMIKEGVI